MTVCELFEPRLMLEISIFFQLRFRIEVFELNISRKLSLLLFHTLINICVYTELDKTNFCFVLRKNNL